MTDLLTPRYIVKTSWPGSREPIGAIISLHDAYKDRIIVKQYALQENYETVLDPKEYPAIFEPLPWYEHRKESELPEYVKWNYMPKVDDGKMKFYVQKVEGWTQAGFGVITGGGTVTASNLWLPATLEDYNLYLQTKTA